MIDNESSRAYFPALAGNVSLRSRLGESIISGALAHAYIIDAPAGSGKRTLALQLAAALSCENKNDGASPLPCGKCSACRKVLGANAVDVLRLAPERDRVTIGVDAVRGMCSQLYIAPCEFDCRVFIIEAAHTMTPGAQNALLLSLEEPPKNVYFILLSEKSDSLLETVRSRAPVLRLEPVPPDKMLAYLTENVRAAKALAENEPDALAEFVMSAGGRIGRALELLSGKAKKNEALHSRELTREFIELHASGAGAARWTAYFRTLPQKRDEIIALIGLYRAAVRDLLAYRRAEGAPLVFFASPDEAEKYSERCSTSYLLKCDAALCRACDSLSQNANVAITFAVLTNCFGR